MSPPRARRRPITSQAAPCQVHSTTCLVPSSPLPYSNVDPNTPNFDGIYKDDFKQPNTVFLSATPVATNYNAAANVNRDCVIAVEGCMDPTAANYDDTATINT